MATRTPTPPDAGADTYASAAGGPPAANPYAAASAQHKAAPHKSKGARFLRMAAPEFAPPGKTPPPGFFLEAAP